MNPKSEAQGCVFAPFKFPVKLLKTATSKTKNRSA